MAIAGTRNDITNRRIPIEIDNQPRHRGDQRRRTKPRRQHLAERFGADIDSDVIAKQCGIDTEIDTRRYGVRRMIGDDQDRRRTGHQPRRCQRPNTGLRFSRKAATPS